MPDWRFFTNPPTDLIWTLALVGALACVCLTLLLLAQSGLQQRRAAIAAALDETWLPWLAFCTLEGMRCLPFPQTRFGKVHVLRLWLHAVLQVEQDMRIEMLLVARQCGLHRHVLQVLHRPWLHNTEMLEVCAGLSGFLRIPEAVAPLRALAGRHHGALSFAAALALLRIDPHHFRWVLAHLDLSSWSTAALLPLLKLAPAAEVDAFMESLIQSQPPKLAAKLLAVWAQLPQRSAQRFAARVMDRPDNEGWLLCAALRVVDDLAMVETVKPLLKHPRWSVRLLAVRALARIGSSQDLAVLEEMAKDENWWLRVRVQEALAERRRNSTSKEPIGGAAHLQPGAILRPATALASAHAQPSPLE